MTGAMEIDLLYMTSAASSFMASSSTAKQGAEAEAPTEG